MISPLIWEARTRAHLLHECAQPVFCHNDLHITNLPVKIMDRDLRLSGILDSDGALAGDPLMDVAKALHYVSAEAKAALLKGYGGP